MLNETEVRTRLLGWLAASPEAEKLSGEEREKVEARLKTFVPTPSAIAYLRDDMIYLHTWAQVWDGLRYLSEPVFVLEPGDPVALGQKVLEAIAGYQFVEHAPATFSGVTKPLQKAAKVRSEKAFFDVRHKRLQIEHKQGGLVFTPHVESGKEYKLQEDKAQRSSLEPGEVGKTLLKTLEAAAWSW